MKSQSQRTLGDAATWIVEEFQRRGVSVPPGSRFFRYAQQLAANAYAAPLGPQDQSRAVEQLMALRDVVEVAKILEAFPEAAATELQPLVRDAVAPRIDGETPGRNRQLELFTGATCRAGGLAVMPDREPDLWCHAGGAWIGVAVKRVRGRKAFEQRVWDAAGQIEKSSLMYGLVCVDVTHAWNQNMSTVLTERDAGSFAFDNRERLSRRLDEHAEFRSRLWAEHGKVLGLTCVDQVFVHYRASGWFCEQFSMFCSSTRNGRHRSRVFKAFQSGWMRGSESCTLLDGVPRTGTFLDPPVDKIMPLREE